MTMDTLQQWDRFDYQDQQSSRLCPGSIEVKLEQKNEQQQQQHEHNSSSVPFRNHVVNISIVEYPQHCFIDGQEKNIVKDQPKELLKNVQDELEQKEEERNPEAAVSYSLLSSTTSLGGFERPLSPFSLLDTVSWFSNNNTDNEPREKMTDESNKNDTEDDDASSVHSISYFDPIDFQSSNWVKASMNVPTVGIAILVASTAILHPVLFIVCVLTAYGTARAAVQGYDYYCKKDHDLDDEDPSSSLLQQLCSYYNSDQSGAAATTTTTISTNGVVVSKDVEDETKSPLGGLIDNNNNNNDTATKNTTINNDGLNPTTKINSKLLLGDCIPVNMSDIDHTDSDSMQYSREGSSKEHNLGNLQEFLRLHYPKLSNTVIQDSVFIGLSAVEFFRVFFVDNAPYDFKLFQERRGDVDVTYGSWQRLPETESFSFLSPAVPGSTTTSRTTPVGYKYHSFQERILTFKAKTNSLLGPPYASTKKTQRMLIVSKRLAVLESRTDLSDIPFADRFFVVERWIIRADKENGIDRYTTHVSVTSEVRFTSSCPFESQIRSKSYSTMRSIIAAWCVTANEALKLTEKSKLERLQSRKVQEKSGAAVHPIPIDITTKKCKLPSNTNALTASIHQADTDYQLCTHENGSIEIAPVAGG